MRRIKTSRQQNQHWGFLLGTFIFIAALSLVVLVLMSAGLTGFAVLDTQSPSNITLSLESNSYPEGTLLSGSVDIQINAPLDQQTQYYATLNGVRSPLSLLQALDLQEIPYGLSQKTPSVETASSSTTLIYSGRGTQSFIFRLPKSVKVQTLSLDLRGTSDQSSYPSFPKLDANRDGQFEWEYLGDFKSFNDTYLLPVGLKEAQENIVSITEQPAYYCELMTLPRGKDFLVSAKYHPLQSSSGADLEAVLFSVSGSGESVTALGGTDVCDLEETPSSSPEYHTCRLSLAYPVSGNALVCVHNAGLSLSPNTYYDLSRDLDKQSGYRCGAVTNGKATCSAQQGDFFIKVQTATYDGVLNKKVSISESAPSALIPSKLNDQLQTCTAYDGFCFLTLDLMSETAGSLSLDGLDITYNDGGSLVHEKNFYSLSSAGGSLVTLDGKDLTQENYTLTLPLDLLQLAASSLASNVQSKNFTLEVGLTPGPSVSQLIEVTSLNATNSTALTGNFADDVSFYQQLFASLLQEHEDVLTFGGFATQMNSVVSLLSQYSSLSNSNASNASLSSLENQITNSLQDLPQSISVVGSSSFTPSVSLSDFTDAVVYTQQKTDKSKQQLAYLQQQYAPSLTATTLEVVEFNGQSSFFTVIEHSTQAMGSSGKMVTIFPSSLTTSLSGVTFTQNPTATLSTSPLTVSWDTASLPSTMRYVLKGNLLSSAEDVHVLFIPEVIPEKTVEPRTRCGDGVCSVLVTNGQRIALEDKQSCPLDCGGSGGSWTWIIVVLLLGVVLYYYFSGMYKGPGNFATLVQIMKKGKKPSTSSSKLFVSSTDEANLRTYVQNALKKGIAPKDLTQTLLNRGWTKQQIDVIMQSKR